MPPGSKKRKAAKKKQQQESSSTQINLKSNHNNHDSPKESKEEQQEAIRIEKDIDARIEITDSSHDHDKSSSNSSSSSSSSSSDDEAREVKKKDDSVSQVVTVTSVPNQPLPVAGDAPFMGSTANAIVENTGLIDSVTPSDLNSEEQHIDISPVETTIENEAEVNSNSLPKPIEITAEASSVAISPPLPESNVVPEVIKEPEVVISHNEEEVTVRPTHGIAQRTSWLSCCGLFDVVSGSSR